jgi:MYXO-CTERM domain-containing protein
MRLLASPSRVLSTLASALGVAAVLLASPRAEADPPILATPCGDDPLYCERGPIKFDRTDALPIQWSFDTGWVPQNSPLSVHIWADIWANTHVALAGSLVSSWPEAMTLEAPGNKEGGDFGFHYGADFGAEGKVSIKVAGKTYSWTGDIPYIPQFDLQVKDHKPFDSWAYDPGVKLSGVTNPQKLASVGLKDIIGGIPGLDGGFELDVAMQLDATYTTEQIVVTSTEGNPAEGGPISSEAGQSTIKYLGGPSIELDVHPEGTVKYDGILHLVPAFYISVLGQSWQIPVADIPISFPITDTKWVFDSQRVHFPLPDLVLPKTKIDFGDVEVGQKALVPYSLWNAGEARVAAMVSSSDPDNFPPWDTQLDVDPSLTVDSAVRFIPTKPGLFTAHLLVASNDPSDPIQVIELRGNALRSPVIEAPPEEEADPPDEVAGCGCRTASDQSSSGGGLGAASLLIGAALLRRRRVQSARSVRSG